MTAIQADHPVRRLTAATMKARNFVVQLHPNHLEIKLKGLRRILPIPYDAIYSTACKMEAMRQQQEKAKGKRLEKTASTTPNTPRKVAKGPRREKAPAHPPEEKPQVGTFIVHPGGSKFKDFDEAADAAQRLSVTWHPVIQFRRKAWVQEGDVVLVRYDRGKEVAV